MINLETLDIKVETKPQPISDAVEVVPVITDEHDKTQMSSVESKADVDSQIRSELEIWKGRCAAMAVERELAMALSSESLLPGVTGQLIQLMRERVVTKFNEKNGVEVVSSDGRGVAESVKEWLKQPEFHHFRPAITRGGTASRTEAQVTERTIGDINKDKSLNEIVINQ